MRPTFDCFPPCIAILLGIGLFLVVIFTGKKKGH